LNFSPIEATPEERARLRREIEQWSREEAAEEFQPLPGESLAEFFAAREEYLQALETFGPQFPPRPSEAWQMVQGQVVPGQGRAPPSLQTRQLKLPFDPAPGPMPEVPDQHPPSDP
jgi:hypothetical protein